MLLTAPTKHLTKMRKELEELLCTLSVVKQNVQGRHWTLQGAEYRSWHLQFGEIYDYLSDAVDAVAEIIVQEDIVPVPPHTMRAFIKGSSIQEQEEVGIIEEMIKATAEELALCIQFIDKTVSANVYTPSIDNDLTAIGAKLRHYRMFCIQTLR